MAWLKGMVENGYVRINRPVKFMKSVKFSAIDPWSTVWYVDGTDGSDSNTGRGPAVAKATIQAAVTAAGRGDVIYIRPQAYTVGTGFDRYTEDVTTTLTQSDLSIIGVTNTINPEFGVRWKHATTQCLNNIAPALHIENIGFFAEGATYGLLMTNDGATNLKRGSDGTTIYNCVIKGKGVYVLSGGTGFTVMNTRFSCAYDGTVAALSFSCSANPGRHLKVFNCEWTDGNGVVPSGPCISIPAPCTEVLIRDCNFPQKPTGNVYISAAGSSNEGSIQHCFFGCADLDTDADILPGGMTVVACYDVGGLAATT